MMTVEELEKLAQLKEKGIITEEEFNAKKDEFLGQSSNKNSNKEKDDNEEENEKIDDNGNDEENSSSLLGLIKLALGLYLVCMMFDIHPIGWFQGIIHSNNPCMVQIKNSAPYGYKNETTKKICSNSQVEWYAIKGQVNNALGNWLPVGFLCSIDTKSNVAIVAPVDTYSSAFINADERLCQ